MDKTDSIQKFQADIAARFEAQKQAVRNAFVVAFGEYQKKWNELPKLETDNEVDAFIQARPELLRAIRAQDLVLNEVSRIASEVLEEYRREIK